MPVGPRGRWLWAASVAALCSACSSVPLERVALAPLESRGARPALACGYRLLAVIDRRATGEAAGSLGANAYSVEDAAGLVHRRLQADGFREDATLPALSVELRQLYITGNLSSKVPVAVYRVSVDADPPRVLRSRATSMNWNGTEAESRRAIGRALDDVDAQLLHALNARCRQHAPAR